MSDHNLVTIASIFSIHRSTYKYAHRDVLVCVNLLAYKDSYKVEVVYDTVQPVDSSVNFQVLCNMALDWVYGSLKGSKYIFKHNFVFNLDTNEESNLRSTLKTTVKNTPRIKELGVNILIKPFHDQVTELYEHDVFSLCTLIPFLIPFNFSGSYTLNLKSEGVEILQKSGLLD